VKMAKKILDIEGMHCASCASNICEALNDTEGIINAQVDISTNKGAVEYDEEKIDLNGVIEVIKEEGFNAREA